MKTYHKKPFNLFFFFILFVFVYSISFGQGLKFEYGFEKGKTLVYASLIETKTTTTMMGQEQVFNTKISSLTKMETADILPDGSYKMVLCYDSLKMESDNPQIPDMSDELQKMNNKKFSGIMAKSGKTTDIKIIDEYEISDIAKGMLSEIDPKERFKNVSMVFPDKELAVNDTWTENKIDTLDRNGAKMIVKTDMENKYVGKAEYEGKQVHKFITTVKVAMSGSGSNQGVEFSITGSGKTTADVYFSDVKGIFLGSKSEGATDMTIDMSAMGMSMPMTIIQASSMKLVK